MRLPGYRSGRLLRHRAFIALSRRTGAELDDLGKAVLRRPDLFGAPFGALAQAVLRGPSRWTVGERELFATAVSAANRCGFCVGTHAEIAAGELGQDARGGWEDGRFGARASAAAAFAAALSTDPGAVGPAEVAAARAAGVEPEALAEAVYVAFLFATVNRVASALDFGYRSDADRLRGAQTLRARGYRMPRLLLR